MPPLAIVALISGGKDSLFSILHCLANGHHVVAIANLHPPLTSEAELVDDLDSFMYQTIGHTVIPLYSDALGIPLYRQEIAGTAVNQSKSYGLSSNAAAEEQDETESLLPLLQRVKEAHPEINAVSTGAILSDYQRTRVESVALRLGLTPLSFLWQWPCLPPNSEASLLSDMAGVGQDSRIIKVASGGLDDSFLWHNVADSKTVARLSKAARRFGIRGDGALLGEGGEYETLAIDGPPPLWKARIEVEDRQRHVLQGEAGSSSLRILNPRLVAKDVNDPLPPPVRTPPLLDPRFESILEDLLSDLNRISLQESRHISQDAMSAEVTTEILEPTQNGTIFLTVLTGIGTTAIDQMRSIMNQTSKALSDRGHSLGDIVYTSIIMRDMADFPAINAVYGSFFTQPNPPARVTIACADVLPVNAHLALAFTSTRSATLPKRCLHVQSQSYWAPANIGPYSQAIAVPLDAEDSDRIVFVAGQIPLIPASMELGSLINDSSPLAYLCRQSVLALQHLHRIGQAMQVKQWAAVVVFVVARNDYELSYLENCARKLWTAYHESNQVATDDEEDAEFDVWHATQQPTWDRIQSAANTSSRGQVLHTPLSPIHVVQVDALPRGASIEWVGYGLTKTSQATIRIPHLQHLLYTFRNHIVGSVRASSSI